MVAAYRTLAAALIGVAGVSLAGASDGGAQLPIVGAPAAQSQVLVRVAPGFGPDDLGTLLASTGANLQRALWPIRVLALRASGAAVELLERHPAVEEVETEASLSTSGTTPNDAHWPGQWGLQRSAFPTAWDTTHGSAETVIAVVDTGVDGTHPDLESAVLPGHDFVDDERNPSDPNGHGTAVAGVLAARTNNRRGIAGACWTCRLLPVRVLGASGKGDSATVAAGIIWAADHGADVINLSLGGGRNTMAQEGAVSYAVRRGALLVAAAGNEGDSRRHYPAAIDHVIAVAATDPADRLYGWSNRGDWVQMAAPGCNTSPWRGAAYATFCGTSSAAPLVAGLAALVRSARPRASLAQVYRSVTAAASHGRLDASRAFPSPRPSRPTRRSRLRDAVARLVRSAR